MENRRLLFAALLSILVVIGWQQLMLTLHPPAEPQIPPPTAAEGSGPEPSPGAGDQQPGAPESEEPAAAAPAADEGLLAEVDEAETLLDFGADTVAAAAAERVTIETPQMRAEFTNLGAQLVSIRLQEHQNTAGEPLELVRPRGTDPYPFALIVDGRKSHPLNKALFERSEEIGENGERILRFRHKSDRGTAEKVFRFTPEGFLGAEITVSGSQRWGVVLGPGVRQFEEGEDVSSRWIERQAVYLRGDEPEIVDLDDVDQDLYLPAGGLTYIGLEDNFFLHAAIPRAGLREAVVRPILQRAEVESERPRFLPYAPESAGDGVTRDFLILLEASGERLEFLNFFGAKQYRRLTSLPHRLETTVDWGFLGVLARPLYFALTWVHEHMVANFGWAIVLVTCLIKLIFLPLTFKSQQSMTKMQELNPKVQAIRNKYRGKLRDKQGRPNVEAQRAMNEEVMGVYKQAGVNPVSGCVPILIQMPVFFAFYRLLLTAVELRGAEWIGWIHDLSVKDPYYLLPIVMGATSIGMQRMMPSAGDPMQRRLMQMMPIMFTFFAFAFPSGLVLYWLTNNLLTMMQQALMLKLRKDGDGDQGAKTAKDAKTAKEARAKA